VKTEDLFRADATLRETTATVIAVEPGGYRLDRTVLYARGGGQPGDRGVLVRQDGAAVAITGALYAPDRLGILHPPTPGAPSLREGDRVIVRVDWPLRLLRMRVHTALHLLSVALPYPVTGGQIGDGEGRLDFDIPEGGLDRAAIAGAVNDFIVADAAVSDRWITDEELDANPGLVKTMKVKPPRGAGVVRLVEIAGVDLQPCGGTHVRRTGEIGPIEVVDIEKKGRQNRRVRIRLAELKEHA
jgi:misacylated tRNA(Ala) deacylase